MKISIIIPAYNVEAYIEKCINSVINQTYDDIEVIIINDGSTDNTAEIIEKYSKIDNRIKIVNKYNSGVSDSRNVGIEMFTGDYVFFLDSDDWVEKDYIIKAVDVLEKNNIDILFNGWVIDTNGVTVCKYDFEKNVINLMEYILSETTMTIVFIPHVFWEEQDDRITCKYFKNKFKESNRIQILDTYKLNYCQIRYAISKCRFFLGARTHAMISAYSVCVPSIALGYSIKSKGISKDLKMPDYTLIDYRNLKKQNELLGKYKMLQQNEHYIRKILEDEIQDYIQKAYDAKECILRLGAYNDKN